MHCNFLSSAEGTRLPPTDFPSSCLDVEPPERMQDIKAKKKPSFFKHQIITTGWPRRTDASEFLYPCTGTTVIHTGIVNDLGSHKDQNAHRGNNCKVDECREYERDIENHLETLYIDNKNKHIYIFKAVHTAFSISLVCVSSKMTRFFPCAKILKHKGWWYVHQKRSLSFSSTDEIFWLHHDL